MNTIPKATALLLMSCLIAATAVRAETLKVDAEATKPSLSDVDLLALRAFFDDFGKAFVEHDTAKVEAAVALGSQHSRIMDNVKREFAEAQYLNFNVLEVLPEYRMSPRRHSVDVTLQFQLVYLHDGRPSDSRTPIQNTMLYTFVIHRTDQGKFLIINSNFFDNLGRHGGGLPLLLANALTAAIGVIALLAFWVWMGSYAWWMRPRSRFWRLVVSVPVIGALIFFFFAYIPHIRRKRS